VITRLRLRISIAGITGILTLTALLAACGSPTAAPAPTKAPRPALQNAASVAALMLTTECMGAEAPKDESAPAMPGGGGMGGMGMDM